MYIVHGTVSLTSNLLDVSEIRFRPASTTGYADNRAGNWLDSIDLMKSIQLERIAVCNLLAEF